MVRIEQALKELSKRRLPRRERPQRTRDLPRLFPKRADLLDKGHLGELAPVTW